MPLYERMNIRGPVGSDDDKHANSDTDNKSNSALSGKDRKHYAGDANDADDEVSEAVAAAFRRCQKKKPMLVVDDSDDPGSDTEYDASSECESDITNMTSKTGNLDDDDDDDNASEDEVRAEAQPRRTIGNSKGTMSLMGTAEELRQMSKNDYAASQKKTENTKAASFNSLQATLAFQYHPLTYPTGDVDATEGFQLSGFKDGTRVYRLESDHINRLRSMVVKTGVGFCYLDIESMLPPKIVQVPADKGMAAPFVPGPATPPLTPPQASCVDLGLDASFPSIAFEAKASSPQSPQLPRSSLELQPPLEQPHLQVNDCFVVRPSALGGLGAFALRDLVRGQHILVERPLFRTTLFNMPRELEGLEPEQRAQFDALTGHHPDPNTSTAEKIWTANTFEAGGMEAIFAVASRFNHACTPRNNIGYHYDRRKNVLIMTAIKKIAAGTELVITYGKSPSELFLRFGFRCVCGACSGFTENMSRQQQLRNWSG